jgi:hypothetical protein
VLERIRTVLGWALLVLLAGFLAFEALFPTYLALRAGDVVLIVLAVAFLWICFMLVIVQLEDEKRKRE